MKKNNKNNKRNRYVEEETRQNRNARVKTRYTLNGRRRTETVGRDPGTLRVGVSTDEQNNSTFMTITRGDETIRLSGRETMTLLRVVDKHIASYSDFEFDLAV